MPRKSLASYLLCLLLISAKLFTGLAFAGTSASQWVVVVNGKSKNSLTLANHYCQLRDIPARNVILLKDIPDSNTITIDDFRKLILGPVLQQIESRQLNLHVQGVAYSCDIPTAIDLREDLKSVKDLPKILTPTGSLNGMTYLFRWVQQSDPSYIGPDSNWYATHDASVLLKIYQGSAESIEELRKWINEDGQHEKAAERFDQLRKESANSFPLDFLAAQQWALAGDNKKAIARLSDAVRKGWKYRGEILNDPSFDALREDKEFQKIVSRCPNEEFKVLPAKAFDARNFFAPNCTESQNPKHGVSYLLSMVLSHTANNRLTIDEAIAHLERSSLADFTNPKGTFYFSKTSDVRTTTREPNFSIAIDELSKLKKDAQIIESVLPPAGSSVAGITFGVSDFDWNRSGAKLIPGSLADNLTSLGGVMTPSSQTKATELLRFGAAAASGTVTEPYALQFKFPLPSLHAYYAKGMTAAEAFYATVQSPYQLLILGDPMCQPFAVPPKFNLTGCTDRQMVSGKIAIGFQPIEEENASDPIQLTWLIDGKPQTQTNFISNLNIQVADDDRGAYEWRFVTKGPKPSETRWEKSLWVLSGAPESHLELKAPERWSAKQNQPLQVQVTNIPKDTQVRLRFHWDLLDTKHDDQGIFKIDTERLGRGPVRLQPVACDDQGNVLYAGLPVKIYIEN
ncbi:MAG: hypothetical protein LW850_24215 [Planctomycetaceae bacterium]|jgi:hypothetical protein|nr:hypothetical protein [Planctomycetaceae bacterium]